MNRIDAVNHWDLPVLGKPRQTVARMHEMVERNPLPEDASLEAYIAVRRLTVEVFDFYRGRFDRADAIRRYG